jgi:hypothetical protein
MKRAFIQVPYTYEPNLLELRGAAHLLRRAAYQLDKAHFHHGWWETPHDQESSAALILAASAFDDLLEIAE